MQFNKSWALKKFPRSGARLWRCWRRSNIVSLSLIRGSLQMRSKMQQRNVSFKSVFLSATCWCSAGRYWAALGVLQSPWGGQQAFGKHQLVCWRCCSSQIPAPSPCWCLMLLTAERGGKGLCVPVHCSTSTITAQEGLELLMWMSSLLPALLWEQRKQQREKSCWHGKERQPNSHSVLNISQNMRHKDCFLQNRLPRFDNEKQKKSRERQT